MHMELHDVEYCTGIKDTNRCLIHTAACDVVNQGDSILSKVMPEFRTTPVEMKGCNILGIRWHVKGDSGKFYLKSENTKYRNSLWKGVVTKDEINDYLDEIGPLRGYFHTDYKPVGNCRYHGNPIKGWQDWVKVKLNNSYIMCQILIFLQVDEVLPENTKNLEAQKYALVHYVNQDVFGDRPTKPLYGTWYNSFWIDNNCDLVRGWSKKTRAINRSEIPHDAINLRPTIGIISVSDIVSPIIGVADRGNKTPHSYLFLPP